MSARSNKNINETWDEVEVAHRTRQTQAENNELVIYLKLSILSNSTYDTKTIYSHVLNTNANVH